MWDLCQVLDRYSLNSHNSSVIHTFYTWRVNNVPRVTQQCEVRILILQGKFKVCILLTHDWNSKVQHFLHLLGLMASLFPSSLVTLELIPVLTRVCLWCLLQFSQGHISIAFLSTSEAGIPGECCNLSMHSCGRGSLVVPQLLFFPSSIISAFTWACGCSGYGLTFQLPLHPRYQVLVDRVWAEMMCITSGSCP